MTSDAHFVFLWSQLAEFLGDEADVYAHNSICAGIDRRYEDSAAESHLATGRRRRSRRARRRAIAAHKRMCEAGHGS